ncbi:MAG: DUF1343 domain-containing protein [Desulfobacterales bacterium]|nr:DUF1343 domain-containing protein [Desulfobacterales bacterium]MCP4160161.1 DUF1343 domain-containing protein [Deltaproteobacteria bacterium]
MNIVKTGLEVIINKEREDLKNKNIALLCNPASVTNSYEHGRIAIENKYPGVIKALFSPQHGFFAEKQDNMIESVNITDSVLNVPVYSLYGETRKPFDEMFDGIDILLIDIQDVGTRVYTFIYTISYCMEVARKLNKKVIVLDRPNPINGIDIEGNLIEPEYKSFVGRFPIPMRHGLTVGELAVLFNEEFKIGCDLEIIRMENWTREMYFKDTGINWVIPSPNMPTPDTAIVYPGQVIWEGTNISEGRGTTQPFEIVGAPFLDVDKILDQLNDTKGVIFRKIAFEPTSNKWANERCHGFQLHITDLKSYNSFQTSIKILRAIINNHRDEFRWKEPPYEYEYKKKPIDLILGSRKIRIDIEGTRNLNDIFSEYTEYLNIFNEVKKKYHLY